MSNTLPQFVRSQGQDIEQRMDRLLETLERVLEFIPNVDFLDGRLLKDVVLNAAANTVIKHKLGRTPQGWFLTKKSITGNFPYDVSMDASDLVLYATSAETVDIWVF